MAATAVQTAMIKLADDFGSVLTGRSVAESLRLRIQELAEHGDVVVDFEGVVAVSPSFADELFAKLDERATASVRFVNVDDDLQQLAEFVRAGRQQPA